VVAGIIRSLNDAHVVLADLTDRNANVFYELGVRHALADRTIIVAQDRSDIPFDLIGYASHVYDWRSAKGKDELTRKLCEVLAEIDGNPDRPDNPVSDFLEEAPAGPVGKKPSAPPGSALGTRSLAGGSEDLGVVGQVRALANRDPAHGAKELWRKTRPALVRQLGTIVNELNKKGRIGSIQERDIPNVAREFITLAEPVAEGIELFGLEAVQLGWKEGVKEAMAYSGDLITITESPLGASIRFATGLPALLALRMLVIMGAKALLDEVYDLTDLIINDPIESERYGRFSHRPLRERRNLFYSEAFLGYANFTVLYLKDLWEKHPHIREFFESKEAFEFSVAQFLMLVSLTCAFHSDDPQFYPGYKLLPSAQASRAMSALTSRLGNRADYREKIAKIIGFKDGPTLEREWSGLASKANEARLGSNYYFLDFGDLHFPTQLEK
jgi:hypothetical protein